MSNTNTGGPAFPQSYQHTEVVAKMYESGELTAGQLKKASSQLAGMTLRDYFAAKAMVGLMSTERANEYVDEDGVFSDEDGTLFVHTKFLAKEAYMIADAMIAAREAA